MGIALPPIGAPATRALHAAGIDALEAVTDHSVAELLRMHGVGPKAVGTLRDHLARHGLSFREQRDE